jgi:ribosomal protein L16 Arg81 hydroxylase
VIHGLGDLVAPIDADEFRATVWGRRHRLVEGAAGRFAYLLPWDELNRILAHHRLEFPRLRLAMDGATVPVESYTDTERNRRGVAVPRLRAEALTERLRAGATLVLDAVDELSEQAGELAAALERDLREHVQVNAYVGWGTTHGFDLHWDDHDVFVLQVAGCKRWRSTAPPGPGRCSGTPTRRRRRPPVPWPSTWSPTVTCSTCPAAGGTWPPPSASRRCT